MSSAAARAADARRIAWLVTMDIVKKLMAAMGSRDLFGSPDVVEVGTKEGTLWRVDSSGKWVKRWFELREDVLASYKAEDRTKLKNARARRRPPPFTPSAAFFP